MKSINEESTNEELYIIIYYVFAGLKFKKNFSTKEKLIFYFIYI